MFTYKHESNTEVEEYCKKLIGHYTYAYSVKKEGPILLLNSMDKLWEEHRQILIEDQKRLIDMAAGILEELIQEGKMKPISSHDRFICFFRYDELQPQMVLPGRPCRSLGTGEVFYRNLHKGDF